jgi:hypothetical protein
MTNHGPWVQPPARTFTRDLGLPQTVNNSHFAQKTGPGTPGPRAQGWTAEEVEAEMGALWQAVRGYEGSGSSGGTLLWTLGYAYRGTLAAGWGGETYPLSLSGAWAHLTLSDPMSFLFRRRTELDAFAAGAIGVEFDPDGPFHGTATNRRVSYTNTVIRARTQDYQSSAPEHVHLQPGIYYAVPDGAQREMPAGTVTDHHVLDPRVVEGSLEPSDSPFGVARYSRSVRPLDDQTYGGFIPYPSAASPLEISYSATAAQITLAEQGRDATDAEKRGFHPSIGYSDMLGSTLDSATTVSGSIDLDPYFASKAWPVATDNVGDFKTGYDPEHMWGQAVLLVMGPRVLLTHVDGAVADWPEVMDAVTADREAQVAGTYVFTCDWTPPRYRLVYETAPGLPPCRVYPREDGLGASSAAQVWPPPKSEQRGGRQGPGSYY